MRKIFILAVVLLVAALAILSFSRKRTGTLVQSNKPRVSAPKVPKADAEKLVADNNAFAFSLYQQLRKSDGNLVFSPYSISTALAMTYAGARGDTEKQMAKALHFGLPQEKLHPAFNVLDLGLAGHGKDENGQPREGFKLVTANALWGQQGYTFLPQFTELVAENYGAGMRLVDYKNNKNREDARKAINDWVEKQTQEKIKNAVPEGILNDLTRLVLVNAIYFKDQWEHPFSQSDTKPGPFTLLDGRKITVQMMSLSEHLNYARGKGYQAVSLPYAESNLSMIILLPDKGTFRNFERALTAKKVLMITKQFKQPELDLTMPKFSFDASLSMKDTLSALGMPGAFILGEANLSGMDGTRRLFIDEVLHKAMIAVDEKGTEAAAATIVYVESGIPPRSDINAKMVIDRPFIFLIRDTKTGTILFLGRVLNPKA